VHQVGYLTESILNSCKYYQVFHKHIKMFAGGKRHREEKILFANVMCTDYVLGAMSIAASKSLWKRLWTRRKADFRMNVQVSVP
jgi:hypothetical protein